MQGPNKASSIGAPRLMSSSERQGLMVQVQALACAGHDNLRIGHSLRQAGGGSRGAAGAAGVCLHSLPQHGPEGSSLVGGCRRSV